MDCEKCGTRKRVRNSRYCLGCREAVMDKMVKDGYIAEPDVDERRILNIVAKKKDARRQRGK